MAKDKKRRNQGRRKLNPASGVMGANTGVSQQGMEAIGNYAQDFSRRVGQYPRIQRWTGLAQGAEAAQDVWGAMGDVGQQMYRGLEWLSETGTADTVNAGQDSTQPPEETGGKEPGRGPERRAAENARLRHPLEGAPPDAALPQEGRRAGQLRVEQSGEGEVPLITNRTPADRAEGGPQRFGGNVAYGDTTGRQLLEASGGGYSQEDIQNINAMIQNASIAKRMEAGDFENMGPQEFSQAMRNNRSKLAATGDQGAEFSDWFKETEAPEGFTPPNTYAQGSQERTGVEIQQDWAPQDKLRAIAWNRQQGVISDEDAKRMADAVIQEQEGQATTQAAETRGKYDVKAQQAGYRGRKQLAQIEEQSEIAKQRREARQERRPSPDEIMTQFSDFSKQFDRRHPDMLRKAQQGGPQAMARYEQYKQQVFDWQVNQLLGNQGGNEPSAAQLDAMGRRGRNRGGTTQRGRNSLNEIP